MPRSIAGLAERQGRFFLAKRKSGGDLAHKWELPGGKLEKGESAEDAMIREWLEELEIQVQVGPLLSAGHFTHKKRHFQLEMYRVEFEGDPRALHEHVEWGWFSPEEINNLDLAGSDRIVLSGYMTGVQEESTPS